MSQQFASRSAAASRRPLARCEPARAQRGASGARKAVQRGGRGAARGARTIASGLWTVNVVPSADQETMESVVGSLTRLNVLKRKGETCYRVRSERNRSLSAAAHVHSREEGRAQRRLSRRCGGSGAIGGGGLRRLLLRRRREGERRPGLLRHRARAG